MHAIIEFQGKQYRVQTGELHCVPHLDQEPGSEIIIDRVLMISDGGEVQVGQPTIPRAKVDAKVVRHLRGPKVIVGKYKKRKDYRRRNGYRDDFTEVEIGAIHTG